MLLTHTVLGLYSGDACHPMLPYLAQGANSAVEDGAVLGLILGHLRSKDQLPKALKMYEDLRKARGDAIVKETFKQVIINRSGTWSIAMKTRLLTSCVIARFLSHGRRSRSGSARQDLPITARRVTDSRALP